MTAINGASAALAASLRGAASPPLYGNSPAPRNVGELVSSLVGNGAQNVIAAVADVAQPQQNSLLYETNTSAALAVVIAGTTGSSINATDLVDSSNEKALQFSEQRVEPAPTARLTSLVED